MPQLLVIIFIFCINFFNAQSVKTDQERVLQSIFDLEEFQNYLATSPRFVGTNTQQSVLMMGFSQLENEDEIQLKVRDKVIKIISEKEVNELDHNFFIRIDEFELKKSKAKVLLSYQNARMYYEKEQKILLDAQLEKNEKDQWVVENYKLYEVSVNTSD